MKKLNINKNQIILMYNQGLSCQKIANELKCSESFINKLLRTTSIIKRSNKVYRTKQIFNNNFFSNINTEEKAYWFGFLMADGCVQNKKTNQKLIALVVKDREVIEKFIISINGNFKPKIYNDYYGVYLTSEVMFYDLHRIGCTVRKSLTLKFPVIYSHLIHHFIRGYFDGDGCVFVNNPKNYNKTDTIYKSIGISICGTKEFLNQLQLNIKQGKLHKEKRRTSNTYNLRFSGSIKCKDFYNYLYKDATIYLTRKKNKFEVYFKERGSTTIISNPTIEG